MKSILCFGDSNTWGYDPVASAASPLPCRHAPEVRWTGVLARELGGRFRVIEEGQNGRTTVHDDPMAEASRNGRDHLPVVLESHKPLDVVVLMLGTNDLKSFLGLPPQDIAGGVTFLGQMILGSDAGLNGGPPHLLLVCPPAVGDFAGLPDLAERFAGARGKSLALPRLYAAAAAALGCAFLDAQPIVTVSAMDGLHFEAGEHSRLGAAAALAVREICAD